jgi:hypothetical protein
MRNVVERYAPLLEWIEPLIEFVTTIVMKTITEVNGPCIPSPSLGVPSIEFSIE